MSRHHKPFALVALIVCELWLHQGAFALTPGAIATTRDLEVTAVLVDDSVVIADSNRGIFSCNERLLGAQSLYSVGSGGLFAVGPLGAYRSEKEGCHWRSVTGPAASVRIVGSHRPDDSSDVVWFAISDPELGEVLAKTPDGGFTSALAGGLALGGGALVGLKGLGDAMMAVSLNGDELTAWHYIPETTMFERGESIRLPGISPKGVRVLAGDGARTWVWVSAALLSVTASAWEQHGEHPEMSPFPGAVDASGTLWVAAQGDGLWRFDGEAWEQELTDATTHVQFSAGRIWVTRSVAHAGWPLVLTRSAELEIWSERMVWPAALDTPQQCASSMAQQCADEMSAFRTDSGLAAPTQEEALDSEPIEPPTSGCRANLGFSGGHLVGILLILGVLRRRRTKVAASP